MEKIQDLLLRFSTKIANKKIEDTRIQLLSLPRAIVNSLMRGGYIVTEGLSSEQLLIYTGFLNAETYPEINHALVMSHPFDDLIVLKRYCNKIPEVIKIELQKD